MIRNAGFAKAQVIESTFPEVNIINMPYGNETFHVTASDMVLEHIEGDPFQAFREVARVTKPGGITIHATVFTFEIHGDPFDFWRYTPGALKLLCETSGFEVIHQGSWGNPDFLEFQRLGFRQEAIPENPNNPLFKMARTDGGKRPMTVWVVGRKL